MRLCPVFLASAFVFVTVISAQPAKPRIGVVNLEGETALASLAHQATVALTSALVNTRMFEVLDQSSMLQEFTAGIARTHLDRDRLVQTLRGEACTETQCLAEMGDALEARFMVAGHLARTGRTTTIAVRLVDVYSTSILSYPTRPLGDDPEMAMTDVVNDIATALIGALPGEARLYGLPTDAAVLIDGSPVIWRHDRPLALAPGRHEVTARRRGFTNGSATIDVEFGTTVEHDLDVERKSALAAMWRSLLLPGFGQFYGARPVRGTLFLVAEIAAIGGIGYTVSANLAANSDYDDAKAEYLGLSGATVTRQQLDDARKRMTDAWDTASSAGQLHLIAVGVFAGLHALNVIDAGVGFPNLSRVRMVDRPNGTSLIEIRIELAGRDRR